MYLPFYIQGHEHRVFCFPEMAVTAKAVFLLVIGLASLTHNALGQSCEVDVIFVVDSSGSINWLQGNGYTLMKQFMVTIIDTLGASAQHAGVLFSTDASVAFGFTNPTAAKSEINGLPYLNQRTNTPDAIDLGTGLVPSSRSAVPDIMIVITDGQSTNGDPGPNADAARAAGVTVIAIGVNLREQEEIDEINRIASDRVPVSSGCVF